MEEECLSFRSLRGQLLFAHVERDTVTLDLILGAPGSGTSELVTVVAALKPMRRTAWKRLRAWAAASQVLEVEVFDRRDGTQWGIHAGRSSIVLERTHPALD